jgi:mono/diheme cytochrome c family protein
MRGETSGARGLCTNTASAGCLRRFRYVMRKIFGQIALPLGGVACVLIILHGSFAFAQQNRETGNTSTEAVIDAKKLFATQCSWCHAAYGMEPGRAPKLAGTSKTEAEVEAQIALGSPGKMPSFGKVLSAAQIEALAHYIKSLPAN